MDIKTKASLETEHEGTNKEQLTQEKEQQAPINQ
jgi:hypothetical protein